MAWSKESRQSRGYGAEWDRVRLVVIARDKGLCQPCLAKGRVSAFRAVDHVVSKAQAKKLRWSPAKTDHPDNLQCICEPCHSEKTEVEQGKKAPVARVAIGLDGWPVE
jgi:5-methylcytosine-specific restriction enzyme A